MKSGFVMFLLASAAAAPALAQDQNTVVDEVVVVAQSPIGAAAIPIQQVPSGVDVISADDLERTGSRSVLRALGESVGQVSLNGAQANPFQPNLLYRGFEASPLAGNAQGLAVYVDGVRFNQPFGDTVNWDLVPEAAIAAVTVEGSNPVFGLNALGGSVDVRLKTGANFHGLGADVSGGAFGRRDGFVEWGGQSGAASLYVSGRALEEDGWRDFSPSSLRQAYANLGWSGDVFKTNLSLLFADNDLTGNGPAPVELLDVSRERVFTHPDRTQNRFSRLALSSVYAPSDDFSLQGVIYFQQLRQKTANGDAAEIEACDADDFEDFVCSEGEDDEPLTDANGDPVEDFLGGGTYALLNRSATRSRAGGVALQMTHNGQAFGRSKRFIAGASYDQGDSRFHASSELGALDETRGYEGPGVVLESGEIGSVGVDATNRYLGLYASDLIELTPSLSLTLSGRYNRAEVKLRDRIGAALNGEHAFERFNPAVGVTWRASGDLSFYGGYSEANRAPTPAELSCADPDAPCSLTNFFVSDPPLKQVIARTFEAGARGRAGGVTWSVNLFRTENEDDLMFVASPVLGRAYFQNVGKTLRQGGEIDLGWIWGKTQFDLSYAITDATFRSPLTLNSPQNPFADGDGHIFVTRGDQMPGVARNKVKLNVEHQFTQAWRAGASVVYSDGQYLYGDEANLNPKTGSFTVVNLATSYQLTPHVQVYGAVENLFDQDYETFGTFSPVDEVPVAEVPDISNPRSLSPAAPRAVFVGLRLRY